MLNVDIRDMAVACGHGGGIGTGLKGRNDWEPGHGTLLWDTCLFAML